MTRARLDGQTQCGTCGKWVWEVIHSCGGIRLYAPERPRPRLLDLFCGAGGAAVGYHRAGFDVVGVDHEPQPDYPFTFVHGDAIEYAARHAADFAAVHGSPPCQTHSALTKGNRARGWFDTHTDLIEATRRLLDTTDRPYVLENVEGSPLRRDLILCGLHFDLRVFRHRYIELGGWSVEDPLRCTGRAGRGSHAGYRVAGWRHGVKHAGNIVAPYGDGGGKGSPREWAEAMGITWTLNKHGLAEAIPPAYTEWVGTRLLAVVGGGEPPLLVLLVIVAYVPHTEAGELSKVARRVLSSTEVGWLFAMDPRTVPAYCRARGVQPLGRVRIGKSWVTRWAVDDIMAIAPAPRVNAG